MKKLTYLILSLLVGIVIISCQKPHEHSYSETNVEPTCLEKGYTEYKCECGDSYKNNFIDEKGHSFGEWIVVKVATEFEEGLKERICKCGEKETETIVKLDHIHSFGDWVVVKVATEEETGLKERACVCGEKETEELNKLEHTHKFENGKCVCGEIHACMFNDGICECGKVEVLPERLVIINQRKALLLGSELDLDVIIYPLNITSASITWSVNKEEIASINSEGVLTGLSCGVVKVTVKDNITEISSIVYVDVVENESKLDKVVERLTIESIKELYLLHDDLNKNLENTFVPADATIKTVYWESSNEEVICIDVDTRTPYIAGVGTATLTCYSVANPDVYCKIDVTIDDYIEPTSIKICYSSGEEVKDITIETAELIPIYIFAEPFNGDIRVKYTSSDGSIAHVSKNRYIFAYKSGTCTITATSISNPEVFDTIELNVVNHGCPPVNQVVIYGENTLYVGYKLRLNASVYSMSMSQEVSWEVHSSSTSYATIDEAGLVTALAPGKFRVRAISKDDPTRKSSYFTIDILEIPEIKPIGDMKGYEIIVMDSAENLALIDPFLEEYNEPDKLAKQKAWSEVEENYNCKIIVKTYPEEAEWGQKRINWIIDNATNGTSMCDIALVHSSWIHKFGRNNSPIDVTELYEKYGFSQMEPALRTAGCYKGKLYVASEGLSQTKTYVDLGLYYNYGWIKELGVESPAKMFNEGRWTYTNFVEWVQNTQEKLGENEYVLGGHPYYYWYGMSNAAGQVIANPEVYKVNITSAKSIDATNLIYQLVEKGCVNINVTWAERNDISSSFWRTDGGTLMTTGCMSNINGKWSSDMWGEGTTDFGYVPFPYPDDVNKENTRIGISGLRAYMYVFGKSYPSSLGPDAIYKIWSVMNTMFLNTVKYQEEDPSFNAEEVIEGNLKSRISDPESIKAVIFYDAKRVFFDAAHELYESVQQSRLIESTINTLYKGYDYMEEFNKVYEEYEKDFLKIYFG